MYLGKADINTYDKGAGREFLITNGRGSYGFSTVIGTNARREHGLLAARPSRDSHSDETPRILLSKVEETLFAGGKKYQLSTNRYKDLIFPDGFRYLQEFQATPFPSSLFVVHGILLRKTLFMPSEGPATVVVKYELLAAPERVRLELRPLIAHRPAGELRPEGEDRPFECAETPEGDLRILGRGLESRLRILSGEWQHKPLWFENLVYEKDERPGLSLDRLWSPGLASVELEEGDVVYAIASEGPIRLDPAACERLEREEIDRIRRLSSQAQVPQGQGAIRDMLTSAAHLIDAETPAILSGYPSARERARDAFIALPGLVVATGRGTLAAPILRRWVEAAEGCGHVVPDGFDAEKKPVCSGADTGLWLFYALGKVAELTGSDELVREFRDPLARIAERYRSGIPALDLSVEEGGLLHLDTNLPERHWMNGRAEGKPIVSRQGCLVELNALWYNALRLLESASEIVGALEDAKAWGNEADRVRNRFVDCFWNAQGGYLFDWVDPKTGARDEAIRPNQILAVSLPFSPLPPELGRSVVEVCWNELYSTYGLRSLDPHHDKFKGRYEGREDQKLKARLRGMAWPWLLGQFITAYLRYNPKRRDIAWLFLRPFNSHFRHGCLGGVAELFDGTMPYGPHGDVLSAMSLGELLRVLHEDLLEPRA
jgi:predicted glycogen debranching enzyme